MRIAIPLVLALVLPLQADPACAQAAAPQAQAPAPQTALIPEIGEIDFGVRVTGGQGDVGRFQRFEDRTSGPTLERLRYVRDRDTWEFTAAFDHVGYRDQRYLGTFNRFGKVSGSFEWNQVPIWYGGVSASPYREETLGVFRLDNALQQAVQNRTATIAGYAGDLREFDTRARRDIADARFVYSATENLDLRVTFMSTARTGEQPWGASFGFNNANEVPLSLQQRTNDVNTTAEWSSRRGMVRVAYDGSWFNNDVEALIWDNPLRFTDQTHGSAYVAGDASSVGRMAMFPDSSAHTVSAAGSLALPARSRAFAYVSVGTWLQDEQLLPFTINTAIDPIPLPRQTAEAEARVTSMTYRLTSRPTSMLWVSGQYRLYDFDNRTPHFPVETYVRLDGNVAPSATGGSHAFEYTRHFVDLDASVTPFPFVAFRVGYGQQNDDRSFRFLEETTDRTFRASVDGTGFSWGAVRLQYDRSKRTGEGFDEEAFGEIGEQISLRQFDISDRTRDRVSAMVQVVPWSTAAFNVTAAIGQENRPDAAFGLQDNDVRSIAFGVDITPSETVIVGASYGFESYSTLQRSRQANPGVQFNDPTRDWETDMSEDVHTWAASLSLPRLTDRAGLNVGYDLVRSNAQYLYLLTPDTSLAPVRQLPEYVNTYHRASADLRYALSPRLALGVGYWLDRYDIEDFSRTPEILDAPVLPAFLNILYQWRPYDVHTGFLRLMYSW